MHSLFDIGQQKLGADMRVGLSDSKLVVFNVIFGD